MKKQLLSIMKISLICLTMNSIWSMQKLSTKNLRKQEKRVKEKQLNKLNISIDKSFIPLWEDNSTKKTKNNMKNFIFTRLQNKSISIDIVTQKEANEVIKKLGFQTERLKKIYKNNTDTPIKITVTFNKKNDKIIAMYDETIKNIKRIEGQKKEPKKICDKKIEPQNSFQTQRQTNASLEKKQIQINQENIKPGDEQIVKQLIRDNHQQLQTKKWETLASIINENKNITLQQLLDMGYSKYDIDNVLNPTDNLKTPLNQQKNQQKQKSNKNNNNKLNKNNYTQSITNFLHSKAVKVTVLATLATFVIYIIFTKVKIKGITK